MIDRSTKEPPRPAPWPGQLDAVRLSQPKEILCQGPAHPRQGRGAWIRNADTPWYGMARDEHRRRRNRGPSIGADGTLRQRRTLEKSRGTSLSCHVARTLRARHRGDASVHSRAGAAICATSDGCSSPGHECGMLWLLATKPRMRLPDPDGAGRRRPVCRKRSLVGSRPGRSVKASARPGVIGPRA